MIRSQIPWAEPRYWGNEEAYALEALRSSWISGGPFVERLETDLERFLGAPHVVATSNGTTALHAAFLAAGLRRDDEVIVPGFGFMAAANVALHMGAIPVFADVDSRTWCVTPETLERRITSRTKGIVPVHTYGNVCDMAPILELAGGHGVWVIEDAAEALGSTYRGMQAGTIAPLGTFSFHATKTITTGEGGAVAASDAALRDRLALYRSHGVKSRRYWHDVAGLNFRLTNMQAALGCAQLEVVQAIIAHRQRLYEDYRARLDALEGVALQQFTPAVEPVVWAVAVRLDPDAFPIGRDGVISALAAKGIETRPGFHAATEMAHLYVAADIDQSAALAAHVISLPSSPTLSTDEITYIVDELARSHR